MQKVSAPRTVAGLFATEGIWYYVWLRPKWYRMYELGPQSSHLQFWRKTVATILLTWYKLKARARIRHYQLDASMPCGRMVLIKGRYGIHHGGEFPKGFSRENELKRIAAVAGLSRAFALNRVAVHYALDTCMDKKQQTALRKLLGKIPY